MDGMAYLSDVTLDLVGPGIPDIDPEFVSEIHRLTGCDIGWHHRRKVFMIIRQRGTAYPLTYPCEIAPDKLPIPACAAGVWASLVHLSDAQSHLDGEQVARQMSVLRQQRKDADLARLVDDITPELVKDTERIERILADGRVDTKFFQVRR